MLQNRFSTNSQQPPSNQFSGLLNGKPFANLSVVVIGPLYVAHPLTLLCLACDWVEKQYKSFGFARNMFSCALKVGVAPLNRGRGS